MSRLALSTRRITLAMSLTRQIHYLARTSPGLETVGTQVWRGLEMFEGMSRWNVLNSRLASVFLAASSRAWGLECFDPFVASNALQTRLKLTREQVCSTNYTRNCRLDWRCCVTVYFLPAWSRPRSWPWSRGCPREECLPTPAPSAPVYDHNGAHFKTSSTVGWLERSRIAWEAFSPRWAIALSINGKKAIPRTPKSGPLDNP